MQIDSGAVRAEHGDKLVVDDLDDHLARRDRADNILPDGLFLDLGDEILDDRQRHIGFQKRQPHFPHGLADVGLLERAPLLEPLKDVAEFAGQCIEHGSGRGLSSKCPCANGTCASARTSRTGVPLGALICSPMLRVRRFVLPVWIEVKQAGSGGFRPIPVDLALPLLHITRRSIEDANSR